MSVHRVRSHPALAAVLGAFLCTLLGCAAPKTGAEDKGSAMAPVDILVFGDSGYDYDWLKAEDHEFPLDFRAYLIEQVDDWIEDKRPPADFALGPFHYVTQTGGWVDASGLWPVASAMRSWCAQPDRCEFGVLAGDNIYPSGATLGADGRDDAQRFDDLLYLPYIGMQQDNPDFSIYAVLGNHDWETSRGGALAEIEWMQSSRLYHLDGLYYRAMPAPDVELFAFDSTVLLAGHTVYKEGFSDDGRPVVTGVIEPPEPGAVPEGDERNIAQWLEASLRSSTARWKIVLAHHPIWSSSSGKYEQAKVLREAILPALCRYADVFLVGHEHTLEVHTDDCRTVLGKPDPQPLVQLVSGAAAKQRPLHTSFMAYQDKAYPEKKTYYTKGLVWGFATLRLESDSGEITILTIPNSGSGETSVDYTFQFTRRSGRDPDAP